MRISPFCLSLALISICTAYAQAQDSRYSRYKECSWRLGYGYYCGGFPPDTCCEVAETPRCVPKSELGSQRCECVDKYDCDVFSENCWRYTCINITTTARSVTLKRATYKVNTSDPYYCDSDSDCLVNKTCKDGKCTIRDRSDPLNIGVRVAIKLGCAILFYVPMTSFLHRWLPWFLERDFDSVESVESRKETCTCAQNLVIRITLRPCPKSHHQEKLLNMNLFAAVDVSPRHEKSHHPEKMNMRCKQQITLLPQKQC